MATTIAVKTKQRTKRDTTAYNELAVRQNNGILEYCRTSMSSLSGAAAGILGLTALYGFAFYFIMAFVLSFLLLTKAGTGWNKYFMSRNELITKGLFGGLFGLKFQIVPSNFEEDLKKESFASPLDYVKETAKQKTLDVVDRLYSETSAPPPDLIIGADTIVTKNNEIFEKPKSRDDAIRILSGLSGSSHTVYTAVVLVTPTISETNKFNLVEFHAETEVFMGELTRQTIETYVDTGEPMDKAGGYGIQALGSTLIEGVKGDYFNVIGFPLHPFSKHMLKLFPCNL